MVLRTGMWGELGQLWASLLAQLVKDLLPCRRPWFNSWVGKICWRRTGCPPQYPGLENAMDCVVHGVTKSWARLSDFHFHFTLGDEVDGSC